MADEIKKVIIDLKFDVSDFTQSAAKLNKEIADLNKQQNALKKAGQEGSIEYQKNSEALKANRSELAETNKVIQNLTIANKSATGSMEQQKAQLSILTLEYNKLSEAERVSGARGKELNEQINTLSSSLKGTEEGIGNNSRSFGNYEKALAGLPAPLQNATSGVAGLGKQFLALLANPVVLVITAIVGAIVLLAKSFTKSEEGANKVNKAMTVVASLFAKVLKVIEPLASFLVDVVIKAFEDLGKAAEFAAQLVSSSLSALGFDEAAKAVDKFVNASNDAIQTAIKLANAEAELTKVKREQRIVQLQSQNDAEKQRQIRDDESKSIAERKKANETPLPPKEFKADSLLIISVFLAFITANNSPRSTSISVPSEK